MNNPGTANLSSIQRGLRDIFALHKNLMSDFDLPTEFPDLNRTHWRTLMHIAETGPDCMKGICRQIGLEAGSFTPVADRLIMSGFLERYRDPDDRRRYLLRLTPGGGKAATDMKDRMMSHFSRRLSVLNPEDRNNLASALNTVHDINLKLRGIHNE